MNTKTALVVQKNSSQSNFPDSYTEESFVELYHMLTYRRPHGAAAERKWINRFIRPLGVKSDGYGNLYKVIGDNPNVMWCCHTDTVHRQSGRQTIMAEGPYLKLAGGSGSNCLGADDTAGAWLLIQMIKAGKPGLYVFHRGEECGRLGSDWIAQNNPGFLEGIEIAIAFDRRGQKSIITHQLLGRCCSDAFAQSLADGLGMGHELDDGGSFTDTASYMDLVPECTNVSVGYYNEHSREEKLHVPYLYTLLDALLALDTSRLIIERTPGDYGYEYGRWGDTYYYGGKYGGSTTYTKPRIPIRGWEDDEEDGYYGGSYTTILELVREYPEEVADILEQYGYDAQTLKNEIAQIHFRYLTA